MTESEYCSDEGQVLADMAYFEQNPDWDQEAPAEKKNSAMVPAAPANLIQIVQLPIIAQHLPTLKQRILEKTREAMSLACSSETLTEVKKQRTELNKLLNDLESQRKEAHAAIEKPYNDFNAVYKDCVTEPFQAAIRDLGRKISAVEAGIIDQAERVGRDYFAELIALEESRGNNLDWLTFEMLNIKIGMTEAKQKTYKSIKAAVASRLNQIAADAVAISEQEYAAEIMAEYKLTLDLPRSIAKVAERHRQIEEEERRQQKLREQQAAAQARAAAVAAYIHPAPVAAAAAPVPAPVPVVSNPPAPAPVPTQAPAAPTKDPNEVLCLRFAATAPRYKLQELVKYCKEKGIELS